MAATMASRVSRSTWLLQTASSSGDSQRRLEASVVAWPLTEFIAAARVVPARSQAASSASYARRRVSRSG